MKIKKIDRPPVESAMRMRGVAKFEYVQWWAEPNAQWGEFSVVWIFGKEVVKIYEVFRGFL